jgi:hydroxyacylglutathione hydrolase
MNIKTILAPGFAQNGYIAWADKSASAVAIDPGSEAQSMIDELQRNHLSLDAIVLTHAHLDHIEGVATLKEFSGADIYMHPDDRFLYDAAQVQAAQFGVQVPQLPPVDRNLDADTKLDVAGIHFEIRHVPGHSPGHVILYSENDGVAFVGDVVFQNSIGRTDLPGGSYQQLMDSIRTHVMTLPNETKLFSGHGPPTTVGEERTNNPFIAPMYGGSFA